MKIAVTLLHSTKHLSLSTHTQNTHTLQQALRCSPNVIGMCSISATYFVTNRNPFPKPYS